MKFAVVGYILMTCCSIILAARDNDDNMLKKTIVFNKAKPDIFFCPMKKPTGFDQLYVYARPISKLCEFNGKPLPKSYKPDCYNNVDETEFACKEKQRIMTRMHPPGELDDGEMKKIEEGKQLIKKVVKKKINTRNIIRVI